jgi:AGZA family xanthine/uracil permease-like MFS transporter
MTMTSKAPEVQIEIMGEGIADEINAGFAFFLDGVVNLFVLSAILIGFGFPQDVLFMQIIPGCIAGLVIGNLLYGHLCRQVQKEHGIDTVTALPLGLDMPTTVGMSVTVYGPLFLMLESGQGADSAANIVWYTGMAITIWMALIKAFFSFYGHWIERVFPRSALIGSIVGISVVWLGAAAFMGAFTLPEIGLVSLVIMAYALIAGHRLPFNMPGAVLAIVVSTVIYYLIAMFGNIDGYVIPDTRAITPSIPLPQYMWYTEIFGLSLNYIAVFVPLSILVAASSVNITVGAKMVGDPYDSKRVIQYDALATFLTGIFGGVIQTTPYFGHTTYKRMGGGWLYSTGVAAVLFVGGFSGLIAYLISILPEASFKPILIVVAADIVRISYAGIDSKYAPSIFFAIMPAILNFTHVTVGDLLRNVEMGLAKTNIAIGAVVSSSWFENYELLGALSRGYVLTGILWATAIAFLIDNRTKAASIVLAASGVMAMFGVIHSILPSSAMYYPWDPEIGSLAIRLGWSYFIAAFVCFLIGLGRPKKTN